MTRIARLLRALRWAVGERAVRRTMLKSSHRPVVDVVEVMLDALAHFFGVVSPQPTYAQPVMPGLTLCRRARDLAFVIRVVSA
jgi:hypothetical protein